MSVTGAFAALSLIFGLDEKRTWKNIAVFGEVFDIY